MFNAVLKLVELLLKALQDEHIPDKKRQKAAKVIWQLIKALDALVSRGRDILNILSLQRNQYPRMTHLLWLQLAELHEIETLLAEEDVDRLLRVYTPRLLESLHVVRHIKGRHVWSTLDQLVSDNKPHNPEEWLKRLQELSEDDLFDCNEANDVELMPLDNALERGEITLYASAVDIENAGQVLSEIQRCTDELRNFLSTKFKFEDVL